MYENEQDSTFAGLLAQYRVALDRGALRYMVPSVDPGYTQRAAVVKSDMEQARRRYAQAVGSDGRDAVLKQTAQSVVVSFSTMGAGDAPSWVYSLAGVPRSLGTAPVPPVPVGGPSSGGSYSAGLSPTIAPTVNASPTFNLGGGLLATLLLWLLGRALDEQENTDEE